MLEMIPLTQANSIDSGSGEDLGLQGDHSNGERTTGNTADEGISRSSDRTVHDDDTGGTQGEGQRLLSAQRGNSEQLGFAGEAGRTGSSHGHVGGLTGSREVEGFDVAESERLGRRRRRRTSTCWQECLVPVKLLQDKHTRNILFVYSVFSVRCVAAACLPP